MTASRIDSKISSSPGGQLPQIPRDSTNPAQKVDELARPRICGHCGEKKEVMKLCGRCELIYYCSPECQKAAWPLHQEKCHPPHEFKITSMSASLTGESTTASYHHRIWSQDQLEQESPKRATVFTETSAAKKAFDQPLAGSRIKLDNSKDAVAYSTGFFNQEILEQLRQEGYQGLQSLTKDDCDELIEKCEFKEILKYIWTESDLQYALNFLLPYAKKCHPILMLEYSRTLCRFVVKNKSFSEKNLTLVIKWYLSGIFCTELDIACCNDATLDDARDLLLRSYAPGNLVPKEKLQGIDGLEFRKRIFGVLKPTEDHPSPEWVLYHGLNIYLGLKSLKPQEEWLAARQKKWQEFFDKLNSLS